MNDVVRIIIMINISVCLWEVMELPTVSLTFNNRQCHSIAITIDYAIIVIKTVWLLHKSIPKRPLNVAIELIFYTLLNL